MSRFASNWQSHCKLWALGLGMFAVLAGRPCWAELTDPTPTERYVTRAVTFLLGREHLSKRSLDDEVSQRSFDSFLKTLDPMKLYFNQSDVDEFHAKRNQLDDLAREGDISFSFEVFNRFLQRVDERVALIDDLLANDFDFNTDEEMITDGDVAKYAGSPAEARDRWRKRLKYDILVQKLEEKSREEAVEALKRRYHSFAKRMKQTDNDELLEMYLTALTTSYDPHTTYMSPKTLDNFEINMKLELDGIGAALQSVDGTTKITKIIPGGAADKDGRLKPEDEIIGVAQGPEGEMVDTVDMKLSDVVGMIRGQRGTIVRLKVKGVDNGEPKVYDITRAKIELKDSEARGEVIEAGQKPTGGPYRIGVIDLPSFYMDMAGARENLPDYKSTTRDVRKLIDEFKSKGIDAVVMDLRRNGGGSLTEAINLTGLFIDTGPVVQVKDADGKVQHYDDLDEGTAWNGPLVVLTSKFSASASEIFAGAIQDYRRGLIVGDRTTHGKGTVQTLLDLGHRIFGVGDAPKLGALKLTMQQFYRPNGDSTQARGVVADVELPSLTSHLDVGESDLDFALKFDRVDAAQFTPETQVTPKQIAMLREASAKRRASSEDFQKVERRIAKYLEQKNRKATTLQEEKFMAERKDLDADRETEKTIENIVNPGDEVVKRDYYFNEALDITIDYINLQKKNQQAALN